MSNDFQKLTAFLERFEPEVIGHAAPPPDPESMRRLERLMSGLRAGPERLDTCELLRRNPTWLRWLAGQVRMARTSAPQLAR